MSLFYKKKAILPNLPQPPEPPEKKSIQGDIGLIKPSATPKPEIGQIIIKSAPIFPVAPELHKSAITEPENPQLYTDLPPPPRPTQVELRPAPEIKPVVLPVMQKADFKQIYDKTIREAVPARVEVIREIPAKQMFISSQDYKKILNDANMIKARLFEAEEFINRLNIIKKQEEELFEKWRNRLEDVEKKISYVDSIVAKAK